MERRPRRTPRRSPSFADAASAGGTPRRAGAGTSVRTVGVGVGGIRRTPRSQLRRRPTRRRSGVVGVGGRRRRSPRSAGVVGVGRPRPWRRSVGVGVGLASTRRLRSAGVVGLVVGRTRVGVGTTLVARLRVGVVGLVGARARSAGPVSARFVGLAARSSTSGAEAVSVRRTSRSTTCAPTRPSWAS